MATPATSIPSAKRVFPSGAGYTFTGGFPTPETVRKAYDDADLNRAVQAYRAALRSLFELKDASGSSVDLYFGPAIPAGHEGRWIKTIPRKGWFVYFRIYGPEQAAFDGSWKPGDVEGVK